ncbi:hypothetical protein D3C78_1259830 [compost metagenome]
MKSINQENDGYEEEQIHRRADHWLPQASGGRDTHQGAESVQGRVVDEAGNPVSAAVVIGALADDSTITATTTTDSAGQYVLNDFPKRTAIVTVTGPTGLFGSTTSLAGTAFPDVVLLIFSAPVSLEIHALSRGTTGWINRNGASLSLVDHIENPGPKPSSLLE